MLGASDPQRWDVSEGAQGMTDIDIERLKRAMENEPNEGPHHENWCEYIHPVCAALALIERLEKAESQLGQLKAAMRQIIDKRKMDTAYIEKVMAHNRGEQSR